MLNLDYQNKGSLFTLFLTSPAFAFCFVCHLNELTTEQWTICQDNVKKIIFEITKLFFKSKLIDHTIFYFFGDDFLRIFLARFVFCYAVLRLHRTFKVKQKQNTLNLRVCLRFFSIGFGFLSDIATTIVQ